MGWGAVVNNTIGGLVEEILRIFDCPCIVSVLGSKKDTNERQMEPESETCIEGVAFWGDVALQSKQVGRENAQWQDTDARWGGHEETLLSHEWERGGDTENGFACTESMMTLCLQRIL